MRFQHKSMRVGDLFRHRLEHSCWQSDPDVEALLMQSLLYPSPLYPKDTWFGNLLHLYFELSEERDLAQCLRHIKCSSEYRLFQQLTEAFLARHMANRVPEPSVPPTTFSKSQTVPNLSGQVKIGLRRTPTHIRPVGVRRSMVT